jgi:heavy metal efflux system protein
MLLSHYYQLRHHGYARDAAVLHAAEIRMRPVLMMCMSACIGLLPAAISTGIGSETQRPLATVIVGGMLLAPVLILLVVPVLISFLPDRPALGGEEGLAPETAEPMPTGANRDESRVPSSVLPRRTER